MNLRYQLREISCAWRSAESRQVLAAVAAAALCTIPNLIASPANAQTAETTVTLTGTDASGASSLNSAGHWSDGLAPHAGSEYTVTGPSPVTSTNYALLRSPSNNTNVTFEGDSLTIGFNTRFLLKTLGPTVATAATLTFENSNAAVSGIATPGELILDGGYMDEASNSTGDAVNIAGVIDLAAGASSGIGASNYGNNPSKIAINALISGSGDLTINGQQEETTPTSSTSNGPETGGNVIFDGTSANTYSGSTTVESGALELESAGGNGTGAVIIQSGTVLDTGANGALTASATTLGGNNGNGNIVLANTLLTAGSAANNVQSGGVLTVAAATGTPAIIDFGAGNTGGTFDFADSSGVAWTGPLDIYDYNDSGIDQLIFGTNDNSLTQTQLDDITFYSGNGTGEIGNGAPPVLLADGQLSPAPEPSQAGMLALMSIGLGGLLLRARKQTRNCVA